MNACEIESFEVQDNVRIVSIATNIGDDGVSITGASVYRDERRLSYGMQKSSTQLTSSSKMYNKHW